MNTFQDKIERLRDQQDRYNNITSKRHPSDVYCPNCDTFVLKLKTEKMNVRKEIHTKCSSEQCLGDMKIIYDTKQGKVVRVFAIGFNKSN